jgi:hypothetical protein
MVLFFSMMFLLCFVGVIEMEVDELSLHFVAWKLVMTQIVDEWK